ncbi:hypothetical protein FA95DRAFT_1556709 [Auriscalpium vulgare]|uniref:Uncharacterized protein n=1 Tax=Auriscalpium vulgare TaxID=40419 RepID=A0ACB8S1C2_9AGAM|nr:hypothetical protein FA95DRAFT_1556709 [Auriscalpium vulgare]
MPCGLREAYDTRADGEILKATGLAMTCRDTRYLARGTRQCVPGPGPLRQNLSPSHPPSRT